MSTIRQAEAAEARRAEVRERLLILLAHAPCGATMAAAIIGATKDQVSGLLLPLRRIGWVERIDGGTGRMPGTFALTEKGAERRHDPPGSTACDLHETSNENQPGEPAVTPYIRG